jgi:diguanylate cyclase (GGDEF)-like protein/PAS domain S-box-containing protein
MSVKFKVVAVILILLGVLLAGNHFVLESAVIPSFEELEVAESERSVRRVRKALEREVEMVARTAADWGAWNDLYRYVADPYEDFIESNLPKGTFDALKFNLLFMYDTEGRVVWGKVFDRDDRGVLVEITVPEFASPQKAWPNALLYGSARLGDSRGLLFTSKGLMLAAAAPILTSKDKGPVRGTLVIGRFLNERVLAEVQDFLELSFDIRRIAPGDATTVTDIGANPLPALDEIRTRVSSDGSVVGYAALPEIATDARWLLRAYTPGSSSALGRSSAVTALTMTAVAGIAVMLALLIAIGSIVVRPLTSLRSRMASLAGGAARTESPLTGRGDEIGALAREFESMLDSLDETTASLRTSEQRYRSLYDETPSMFLTVDEGLRIRSANEFGARAMGYEVEALYGMPAQQLYIESDRMKFEQHIAGCYQQPDVLHKWELRKERRDGEVLWVQETARVLTDDGLGQSLLIVSEDVTEARRLSQELTFQATHDTLTELVNRREFERRVGRVLNSVRASGSEHALCYLDLDQFKVVNDTCGHAAGDELLRQLSRELSRHLRRHDTLARLGGDEFALLLEHCSLEAARHVADTLLRTVRDFRFEWNDTRFAVGVSIGLVPIDATSDEVDEIMSCADAACCAAKDEGRNRIKVFRPGDRELATRFGEARWVTRLQTALEEGRFRLYRQVIAPLNGCTAAGEYFEILLRMVDEKGRIIAPESFLSAAERYGIIGRLDRWVIGEVLEQFTQHADLLDRVAMCSVNVSGQSLSDDEFLEFLFEALERTSVPASKLCFEITETAAIADLDSTARFMARIRALGCRFALDDFGSGVSSFAYLRQLPVDLLKIDGVFIKNLLRDPANAAITRSINDIAHTLGNQTIAEFVESESILREVRSIGIDYAQGYAVGRPVPLSDLVAVDVPPRAGSPTT